MAYLIGTSGNDSLVGTSAADTIDGLAGNDTLVGLAGNDRLNGGAGDDRYVVATGDILSDTGGIDTVESSTTWSLGAAFENLILTGTGVTSGSGNELANVITGSAGNNWLRGRGGDDTIFGGGGNDTFNMSLGAGGLYGNDVIDGGTGTDTLDFGAAALTAVVINLGAGTATGGGSGGAGSVSLTSVENANGGAFNDLMYGSDAANFLFGYNGDDTLDGGAGRDRLEGGAGSDRYVFSASAGSANADTIVGFVSGSDKIVLDGGVHANAGADGAFSSSDGRFVAGAGLTQGYEQSHRVIYNTTTGELFYDADGYGAGAGQLIAILQGAPSLLASDIVAQNSASGRVINGTAADDSLVGSAGPDTMYGNAGNDRLDAQDGDDRLDGGPGSDSLRGGAGADVILGGDGNDTVDAAWAREGEQEADWYWDGTEYRPLAGDTVDGGLGDDLYYLKENDVLLGDAGGNDTIVVDAYEYVLPDGIENLRFDVYGWSDGEGIFINYGGNSLDNFIVADWVWDSSGTTLDGGDGNDTLHGSGGEAIFKFSLGTGNYGHDVLVGGNAGTIDFDDARSAIFADLAAGTLTGGGSGGSGSASFTDIDNVIGGAFDDTLIANPKGSQQYDYAYLRGGAGKDTIEGVGGGSSYFFHGEEGDDRLVTRTGADAMTGGAGADQFVFAVAAGNEGGIGSTGWPSLVDFTTGEDKIVLDAVYMPELGTSGNFTANDARFFAAPGATGGQQTQHRVVYDTSTNQLYYDPDGDGSAPGQLIASLQFGAVLVAGDIAVERGPDAGMTLVGSAGDDTLVGGPLNDRIDGLDGNDSLSGLNGQDVLNGGAGNDTLEGGGHPDTLDGGLGDDVYIARAGDTFVDAGGIDHVFTAEEYFTLAPELENLTLTAPNVEAIGNELPNVIRAEFSARIFGYGGNDTISGTGQLYGMDGDDLISGANGGDYIVGGAGNDSLRGFDGDDWFDVLFHVWEGNYGSDTVEGGAGVDRLYFNYQHVARSGVTVDLAAGSAVGGGTAGAGSVRFTGVEDVVGTEFADHLMGDSGSNYLGGGWDGNDTLEGRAGNDVLDGGFGGGVDTFVFAHFGSAHADDLPRFASGADKIALDAGAFTGIGAAGDFSSNDVRFFAAAGANAAHDADDRIIYNTSTGQLWYDGDGSGGASAQLIATIATTPTLPAPTLVATDIRVFGVAPPPPPPPPPSGGQAITGTSAAETLTGGAGNDTISGLAGSDRIFGADGNDRLLGGTEADNIFGDNGNDWLDGDAGQDRLTGGAGADSFVYNDPLASANADYINDFVSGTDKILLDNAVMTALGADGALAAGRFVAAPNARSGLDADDRLMYDTVSGKLYYDADGSGAGGQSVIAVLTGAPSLAASDIVVI